VEVVPSQLCRYGFGGGQVKIYEARFEEDY